MSVGLGLRGKLILVCLVVAAIPLVVVWSIGLYEGIERRRSAAQLRQAGRAIVAQLEARSGAGGRLERLARKHHVLVRIIGPGGQVMTRTDPRHADRWSSVRGWFRRAGDFFFGPSGPPDLLAFEATLPGERRRREVRAAMAGRAADAFRRSDDGRLAVYYRAIPSPDGGALYLTRYARRNIRALYGLRYQLLKLTLILAALAAAMGLWVGWRMVNPVVQLQHRIREHLRRGAEAGSPAELALPGRRDEIGALAADGSALSERLAGRVRRTSEAAAELAHRLKSPISTVKATAELLGERADDERSRRLARALADAGESLAGTVDGMLRLAELDEALASRPRATVDLRRLVGAVCERAAADPARREVTVETVLPAAKPGEPPLAIWGAAEQLEAALAALIENALSFARGRVVIGVRHPAGEHDAWVELYVADDGPGVSGGHRDHVFDRYFTGRPDQGGTGLGLAVARAVAEAHGGQATLAEREAEGSLGGACFVLRLPLVAPPG